MVTKTTTSGGLWIALLSTVLLWVSPARANCAAPTDYSIDVQASTVRVSLRNFQGRVCPDPGGLLRQDVSTGEVVKLADFCGATDAGQPPSYVDECVPPGTYHYGLADPYHCESASCGTYAFEAATVSSSPDGGCVRGEGNAGPTPASGATLGSSKEICGYRSCGCGGQRQGAGTVLSIDALVLAVGVLLLRRRGRTGRRT
jgi:hypothetical protein